MNTPSPIAAATNLMDYFRQELQRAFTMLGLQPRVETEAYLVQLLEGMTRLKPGDASALGFERPAALMLGDAVFSGAEHRVEAYRKLGDACLINCGLFAARLTRRHVSERYYHQLGREAYERVGAMMERKQPGGVFSLIFDELAQQFEGAVLAVRQLTQPGHGWDDAQLALERLAWGMVIPKQ